MTFIIIMILTLALVPTIASIITLHNDYKHYSVVYHKLKYASFTKIDDMICSNDFDDFIWFTKTDDFKLCDDCYLHSSFVTYFDPYSYYWLCKYRRWCKANISSLNNYK